MKVFLRTFGCRANHADTERVRALALAAGAEIVEHADEADVAVFNSCTVTAEAEADLRASVRRAAAGNRAIASVVMGCAAARDEGAIAALPSVHAVIDGGDVHAVARAIGIAPSERSTWRAQSGTRALLRIQDGCAEHCTFCATTLARGAHRSRSADDLVREAIELAEHHTEIVLTGTHIGTWGAEWSLTLGALVERLVREVPTVRFRITSIEATEIDERLRALFDEPRHLAPHVHAPLQSGSDAVLRRMGRHWYDAASYERAIERLVSGRPTFALGADIMTGFPGERDADMAATVSLVERLPFTYLHVFPYSARPGTAATRLGAVVSHAVATERARELRDIAERKRRAYEASREGGAADVVAIGSAARREGVTGDYLTVALADPTTPRGSRFDARLERGATRLIARATSGIFRA